jgi:uncharacterized protein (DUF736 family)
MKLKLFIWKNKEKKEEKQPDYRITMVDEKKGFVKVGAGWIAKTKTGDSYINCQIDTEPTPWKKPESLNTEGENAKIIAIKEQAKKAETKVVVDEFTQW